MHAGFLGQSVVCAPLRQRLLGTDKTGRKAGGVHQPQSFACVHVSLLHGDARRAARSARRDLHAIDGLGADQPGALRLFGGGPFEVPGFGGFASLGIFAQRVAVGRQIRRLIDVHPGAVEPHIAGLPACRGKLGKFFHRRLEKRLMAVIVAVAKRLERNLDHPAYFG